MQLQILNFKNCNDNPNLELKIYLLGSDTCASKMINLFR